MEDIPLDTPMDMVEFHFPQVLLPLKKKNAKKKKNVKEDVKEMKKKIAKEDKKEKKKKIAKEEEKEMMNAVIDALKKIVWRNLEIRMEESEVFKSPNLITTNIESLKKNLLLPHLDNNAENLCGSAILCPTNSVVQQINNNILSRMKGNEKIFESIDSPLLDDPFKDLEPMSAAEIDQSMETMNKIETAGLPPHKLKLKVGSIVMLIKNLSVATGLCNGTRMQIKGFNDSFIKCQVLTGPLSKNKDQIFIPRCKFSYGGNLNEKGIRFTRLQFPVKLSFAITINKAQGQTLERLGLYFRSGECFAHGQLYTAMSRVRAKASLKVMTADETKNTTKNVIWKLLLN